MSDDVVDTVSVAESKIIFIAKGQYDKGYHGGTFTPGFVRKETGYGYGIIDSSLDSLVERKYLERSKTTIYRQGVPTEIDLFRITEKGLQAIERIRVGTVRVLDKRPSPQEEGRSQRRPVDFRSGSSDLLSATMRIEAAVALAKERTLQLHEKIERISPTPHSAQASEQPRRIRTVRQRKATAIHQLIVLQALFDLQKSMRTIISSDIEGRYAEGCAEAGVAPKRGQSFALLLKSMQRRGLLDLKTAGCRELGIKGHGSRTVLIGTSDGKAYLDENING
jgi:hypothetical protein